MSPHLSGTGNFYQSLAVIGEKVIGDWGLGIGDWGLVISD
jgi:hypothetical protein